MHFFIMINTVTVHKSYVEVVWILLKIVVFLEKKNRMSSLVNRMSPLSWNLLKTKHLNRKIIFKILQNFDCISECKGVKIKKIKGENSENICHPKPVSFCNYAKFGGELILPFGCHHYFGDDCKECSVTEKQEVESEMYSIFSKQT